MTMLWFQVQVDSWWSSISFRATLKDGQTQFLRIFLGTNIVSQVAVYTMPHHAEGRVDPDDLAKKSVTDLRYPRACRFRKYQFENR
jgi:hypothetical protein